MSYTNNNFGSNQTVAGLKPIITNGGAGGALSFKSDRCGIETIDVPSFVMAGESSNQTVAGLKHKVSSQTGATALRSNQTVAGLKQKRYELQHMREEGSNQTVAGLKLFIKSITIVVRNVQIRPLRD